MNQLKVRKIDFQFPDDIAFQWNPGNPYWGNFVNYATLIAPAFERYFIKATRQAMPKIRCDRVRLNADLFCRQEAQHSKHHLAHLRMLTQKYPGLEQVRKDVLQSYEDLFAENYLEFHLAYAAVIESFFGPLAKFVIEQRNILFKQTDARIASFILWHLVEEFEHRNAAIDIYNDVVGSYRFRLRASIKVVRHMFSIDRIVRQGFKDCVEHVPGEVGPSEALIFMHETPVSSQIKLLYDLGCTLLPYHDPNNIQQPDWVTQWFADEQAGMDMRCYYPPS